MTSFWWIIDKHAIVDMLWSKWTFRRISHPLQQCFILIGWLVLTIFQQFILNLENGWLCLATGIIPVWKDFPGDYTSGIDFPVLCLHIFGKIYLPSNRRRSYMFIFCCNHGEVWQCKRRRICLSRMRCHVLNILLSSLAGTAFLCCCLVRYSASICGSGNTPHTIGDQFPQEKTIIEK